MSKDKNSVKAKCKKQDIDSYRKYQFFKQKGKIEIIPAMFHKRANRIVCRAYESHRGQFTNTIGLATISRRHTVEFSGAWLFMKYESLCIEFALPVTQGLSKELITPPTRF
jgi:hypothetical protein